MHIIRQLVAFQPKLCLLTNREQEAPICMAAKMGHLEAVKELIEINQLSVMKRNRCGMNILHLAAQVSQVRIVDYLRQGVVLGHQELADLCFICIYGLWFHGGSIYNAHVMMGMIHQSKA